MRQDDGLPPIITVAGLKKSGKTTVASALIRELRARGFRVGSVKTIRHHPLTLDASGADTRRHAEAGAEFTVVLLDKELAYFETRESRPVLGDAARLFAPGIDFVVWEGMSEAGAGPGHVVCLRQAADFEKTLAERQVQPTWIIAISGVASGAAAAGLDGVPADIPVVDATSPRGAAALADLVVRWFGEGRR